ncbi:MAG: IS630 family transposase [Hormoscilla sp. GUM202]|nr:IS630 family transposase [Hormoscilla sp. GUM202]MBO1351403.1 IS630 family transposase [Hormoscilla sp. GUM202]
MKPYSVELRQKIIETYENEVISQRQLAKRFRVAFSFVIKILKQYRSTGNLDPKKSTGRPLKLNQSQQEKLKVLVEENNDWTLEEYRSELEKKTGGKVRSSTIDRMTKRWGLTIKKKALHPTEKKSSRVQQLRFDYWKEIEGIEAKDLIFLDEGGCNLAITRGMYARSQCGLRAYGSKPSKRGQNVSIVGAVSLNGIVSSFNILGAYDSLTFEAFIIRHLVPKLCQGACVVMDNCKIHQGDVIRQAIEKVGARLVYLPPYSPDFSPIENLWSKLKSYLKKLEARNYRDLVDAIQEGFATISKQDIYNWFTHCCYCTSPF